MTARVAVLMVALAGAPFAIGFAVRCHQRAGRLRVDLVVPASQYERLVRKGIAEAIGRRVRGLFGKPSNAVHDHGVGRALVLVPAAALLDVIFAVTTLGCLVAAPLLRARRERRARAVALMRELPEIVDLYAVALNSGHNIATASREVARRGDGQMATALTGAVEQMERGQPLDVALDDLPIVMGAAVRPVTAVLVAGLRYGVPVAASLERVAADLRLERRRQSEQAARRLPVVMLFPLVLCVLPAFGLLTVVPVLVESLQSLSL